MPTQGVLPLVNVLNKPTIVSLNTQASDFDNGSALSDVTWRVDTPISTPANYAAKVSVLSMNFYNSFNNITVHNNTFKVLTLWKDNAGVIHQEVFSNRKVPVNFYEIRDMRDILNSIGFLGGPVGGYNQGFGWTTVSAFELLDNDYRFGLNAPEPAEMGPVDLNHQYLGFYMVIDDETAPFMRKLGFAETDGTGSYTTAGVIQNATSPDNRAVYGIGFSYINDGNNYQYADPNEIQIEAPNFINLPGPLALAVSLESVRSSIRIDKGLREADTIAVVPVSGAFGVSCQYTPAHLFSSYVTNLDLPQFRITVRDPATNALVDFQGVGWVLNIKIEMEEIENGLQSNHGEAGIGQKVLPLFRHENPDHMHNYSGVKRGRLV